MPPLPELAFESTQPLSRSEFHAWTENRPAWDSNRYELLGGRVVMTPPARHPHGFVEARLAAILGTFVHDRQLGICLGSSQGFDLPSGDIVEPDYSFVSTAHWQTMPPAPEGQFLRIVPDLVVEVLSPSTSSRDRGEKRTIYERNGVGEYWLVDSRVRGIVVFSRRRDGFDGGQAYEEDAILRSEVLTGLRVEVRSIFPASH